jgi:hypothetical protein
VQTPPRMSAKGFFGSLFDFSFSSLITTKIIKLVYIIATIVIALFSVIALLGGLVAIIAGAAVGHPGDVALGLLYMLLTPIFWLIYMILTRIYLELVIILFRIGEDVRRLVDAQGLAPPSGPSAYAPAPPGYMGSAPPFYTPPPAGGYPPPPTAFGP